jgi:hypothetical protein
MNNRRYYNNRNVGVVPIVAVAAAKPIAALVSAGIAALPGIISFIRNISKRPAGEARDVINEVKKQIQNTDARNRMALVVAASGRNFKAADVDVNELLYWYRQNYADDYQKLLPEDKLYWNNYLDGYRQRFLLQRPDLQNNFLNKSYFTRDQINYNTQTTTTPGTPSLPGTQKAGMNIWLTLGIVGAGIYLLTKKKK